VLERFHEEGESAKTTDRSRFQSLLTYCRLNKGLPLLSSPVLLIQVLTKCPRSVNLVRLGESW